MSNSSAELSVLMDFVELTKRCGLRPADADASIHFYPNNELSRSYRFSIAWAHPDTPESLRLEELLGMKDKGDSIWASDIRELEDIVQNALDLAPRARVR